jgi:AraC-like DNA-binding protein
MTITTRHAEIDRNFQDHFNIRYCSDLRELEEQLEGESGVVICFEFDYPDRPGMSLLCNTKERYPHIPIIMLTVQHSERLAVWAYRNRVLDYLVKPLPDSDFHRCKDLLEAIHMTEDRQNTRPIIDRKSIIPVEIPVGQRTGSVRLAPAVHFVQKNFRDKIRNANIARLCGMSSFHFSHAFAETFSLTFQDFVLRYRIFEAAKELQHPNVPIANVAYSVGFNDPSYFARVFRRFIGASPSEYCEMTSDNEIVRRVKDLASSLEMPELKAVKFEPKRAVVNFQDNRRASFS